MKRIAMLIPVFVIITSCLHDNGNNDSINKEKTIPEFTSIDSLVKYLTPFSPILYQFPTAEQKFVELHQDEIKNTLNIAEKFEVTPDLTAVFISYSLKTEVIRSVMWIRKIEGKYYMQISGEYKLTASYYSKDELREEFQNLSIENLNKLRTKIKDWEEASKDVWWMLY